MKPIVYLDFLGNSHVDSNIANVFANVFIIPVLKLFVPLVVLEDSEWVQTDEEDLPHIPYSPKRFSEEMMLHRSYDFYTLMNQRRSVRFISPEPVPQEVINNVILTAGMCN